MMETMTLTEFLLARYDEREVIAQAAAPRMLPGSWRSLYGTYVMGSDGIARGQMQSSSMAEHVAANNPAAVLADLAVKRAIVGRFIETARPYGDADQQLEHEQMEIYVIAPLALPFANHPDYNEAWRP